MLPAFLLIFSARLVSQDACLEYDRIYGLDPLIYNGKKYAYFLPSGTKGTQYLVSDEFISGTLDIERQGDEVTGWKGDKVMEGKGDLMLNYDVFNQKLVLKFNDETGAEQMMEVSEAWLKGFSAGDKDFIYADNNSQAKIYQSLGTGKYRILYHWRKNLRLDNSAGHGVYTFSSPLRTSYVMIDNEIRQFGSKGSLIKIFDPEFKIDIKNYLKVNKISLKNSTDPVITALIDYISNLQ